MFKIPTYLETDRLILRFFEDADWCDLHVLYSDPQCVEHTIKQTLTEGESWRMLATIIGHWHLRGYGPYAVCLKSGGPVMGPVGLWYPNDWPEPEIKWAIARKYWGNGYAREAAKAVWQIASTHLPELHLISLIFPENERSKKLAGALGAEFEKEIDFRDGRAQIFRHVAPLREA